MMQVISAISLLLFNFGFAQGQSVPGLFSAAATLQPEERFKRGNCEGGIGSGLAFSPFVASLHRPTYDYALGFLQLGYMLTDINGSGPLRGNLELLPEGFAGGIYEGKGAYLAGMTFWTRYNFVQPRWRLIPYAQIGVGFLFADIDRRIVGQSFNFNVDAAVGCREFLSARCSLNLEYRYQHISNAGMGVHNLGINAHGPTLSVSWFF